MDKMELCLAMGNQQKCKIDGIWYKADSTGYQGLAEVVSSQLLKYSNLDFKDYVVYEPAIITREGRHFSGCKCKDFLEGRELVTLEKLSLQYSAFGLQEIIGPYELPRNKIIHTVKMVERYTGIKSFDKYLAKMVEMDAFFLNDGRDTKNIYLIYNGKEFELCPYFDMGAALFSNIMDKYSTAMDYDSCMAVIEAKPFATDFDKQLEAAHCNTKGGLKFGFSGAEIGNVFNSIVKEFKLNDFYAPQIISRVEVTLRMQARKYNNMFV